MSGRNGCPTKLVKWRTVQPTILILNWRDIANPLAGGAEVHIWEVFRRLVQRGWKVAAICSKYVGCDARESVQGIQVFRCGGPLTYSLAVPSAYFHLRKDLSPDIVIDFMNKLPLFSPLYVRRPLICFVHHLFGEVARNEVHAIPAAAIRACESLVPMIYADTPFLVGSDSTADDLENRGIPRTRIRNIPYGVDTLKYTPGKKSESPTILYIGRLKRYKGVEHLLQVTSRLVMAFSDLHVDIVGQGDDRERLATIADSLRLSHRVTFHGFVSEEAKVQLYGRAWVLCFPSAKEGFGLTVAEAALCGTPAVAYDVPGLRDAVRDGQTGLLVPYGDLGGLADALARVLEDRRFREQLADAAMSRYQENSWDASADTFEATLKGLLGASR